MNFDDLPRGRPGTHPESGEAPRSLWLDPAHLTGSFFRYRPGRIFLGLTAANEEVGVADNRHLITVAGSRAGKGTSAIVPNLLRYEGSVFVLDPKGENASITARRRGRGEEIPAGGMHQDVHVLDPFGKADVPEHYRSGFNPLAALDPAMPGFIDDCDALADALVVSEHAKEHDFWNSSARIVLRGFIAYVAGSTRVRPELRNLSMVRSLLILPKKHFRDLLVRMSMLGDEAAGVPREAAGFLLGMDERERASVMATVLSHIAFLASPEVAALFAGGKRQADLKRWKFGGVSIYLCLPAMRLHRHSRFFRLYVTSLLLAIESIRDEPDIPGLMILDEMHVLGHMEALEAAAGLIAGYGVRIWSIWQDFAQLEDIYKDRWETFLGNASIFQSFGLNDLTTLKYVSERLGTSPVMQFSTSEISREQAAGGFTGKSKSFQGVPLLSPDEVAYFFSRQSRNALVMYPGSDPLFLRRAEYFRDERFRNLVRPKDFKGE